MSRGGGSRRACARKHDELRNEEVPDDQQAKRHRIGKTRIDSQHFHEEHREQEIQHQAEDPRCPEFEKCLQRRFQYVYLCP